MIKLYIILVIILFFIKSTLSIFDLERKIIFTHPPKCGGTSVEFLLLPRDIFQHTANVDYKNGNMHH